MQVNRNNSVNTSPHFNGVFNIPFNPAKAKGAVKDIAESQLLDSLKNEKISYDIKDHVLHIYTLNDKDEEMLNKLQKLGVLFSYIATK